MPSWMSARSQVSASICASASSRSDTPSGQIAELYLRCGSEGQLEEPRRDLVVLFVGDVGDQRDRGACKTLEERALLGRARLEVGLPRLPRAVGHDPPDARPHHRVGNASRLGQPDGQRVESSRHQALFAAAPSARPRASSAARACATSRPYSRRPSAAARPIGWKAGWSRGSASRAMPERDSVAS